MVVKRFNKFRSRLIEVPHLFITANAKKTELKHLRKSPTYFYSLIIQIQLGSHSIKINKRLCSLSAQRLSSGKHEVILLLLSMSLNCEIHTFQLIREVLYKSGFLLYFLFNV